MADLALRDAVRVRLQSILSSASADVEEYLQAAVECVGALVGIEASFTLSTVLHGHPYTVATTDRDGWEADQIEFDTADGPCFETLFDDAKYDGIDLRSERRWPAWSTVAELLGFASAAAVGADVEPGQKLVLNCYSVDAAFLDITAVERVQQFIDELAFSLPFAFQLAQRAAEVSQLQEALASRSTIDQALGVLMGQNQCTRDEAFGILRRASQNRNIKVRDVAAAIIYRYTGHHPAPPPPFRSKPTPGQ